jgi:O-antigen/teichoic acid export membrane protein
MLSLQILSYNIAIANGYTKLNNIIGLISVFITIPGYIVATKQYGSIGAALAFAIIQTTITIVYLYFINKRYLNYRIVKDVYIKQIKCQI